MDYNYFYEKIIENMKIILIYFYPKNLIIQHISNMNVLILLNKIEKYIYYIHNNNNYN